MLHLQSGALVQAIPVITYAFTNPDGLTTPDSNGDSIDIDFSTPELGVAEDTILTSTITRSPTGYTNPTDVVVTITRQPSVPPNTPPDPDDFAVTGDGPDDLVEDNGVWTEVITFDAQEDTKTIEIRFTGNDTSNSNYEYDISIAPIAIPGTGLNQQTITFTITDDERGLALFPAELDDSAILEMTVENDLDGLGEQQFVGIYPAGTDATEIITAEGGDEAEFTITGIELTITGANGDVMLRDGRDNSAVDIANVDIGSGVIGDVEAFLGSLQFGFNNDEPTGFPTGVATPSDPIPSNDEAVVTVALAITYDDTTAPSDPDREAEETVTRTIDEENDPVFATVSVVPSVQNTNTLLLGGGFEIATGTAHDGRDDSGIARDNSGLSVLINGTASPLTIPSLTAADGGVGALTLTGSLVGENFTLNATSSGVELEEQEVSVTLSFSDGRSPTASEETRTITINIIERGLVVLDPDDRDIPEMMVENDLDGQQFIGVYSSTETRAVITEVGGTFTVTQIVLNITGGNGDAVVADDGVMITDGDAVDTGNGSFSVETNGNESTFRNTAGVGVAAANSFLSSLGFGIDDDEPTGFPTGSTTPRPMADVAVMLTITDNEGMVTTVMVDRTIIEEKDPFDGGLLDPDPTLGGTPTFSVFVGDLMGGSSVTALETPVGGGDSDITPDIVAFFDGDGRVYDGMLRFEGTFDGEIFSLIVSSGSPDPEDETVRLEITFMDSRGGPDVTRTIVINIRSDDIPPTVPPEPKRNIVAEPDATRVALGVLLRL